jgi:hypothetical protein
MRYQGGFEAMVVASALIFILMAMVSYAYYVGQDLDVMQKEADYFDSCSKLQVLLVSSSFVDQEVTTYFLYNMTLDGDSLTAYPDDPEIHFVCPILIPANGSIVVPSMWYYPINGTKFVSEGGVVNVTWGWYE